MNETVKALDTLEKLHVCIGCKFYTIGWGCRRDWQDYKLSGNCDIRDNAIDILRKYIEVMNKQGRNL